MTHRGSRAAALLCGTCLVSVARHSAEAAGAQAGAAARSGVASAAGAIPEYRVEAALAPLGGKPPTSISIYGRPLNKQIGPPISSTISQDLQKCPLVKLPATVVSKPLESTWTGQAGVWESFGNNVRIATWAQNYFSQEWQTMYIKNQDGRVSLRAEVLKKGEVLRRYGWVMGQPISSYTNVTRLEERVRTGLYRGVKVVHKRPGEAEIQVLTAPSDRGDAAYVALGDCDRNLLFVVRLGLQDKGAPGSIDIFDRAGALVAHGLVDDPVISRYQFVDANGFLLATAEAPGLGQAIRTDELPVDPIKGNILPYALSFETGGYPGASRLMEVEYRWVFAAAVSSRAALDGHKGWSPRMSFAAQLVLWCFGIACIVAFLCTFGIIYRLVYPPKAGLSLWGNQKGGQRPARSYEAVAKAV